jgi:2,5-diketo-D-gluconate reductase B
MTAVPTVSVHGAQIPALGFGTSPQTGAVAADEVVAALKAGYRHIDTARKYGSERAVGEAMRASGVPRGEIFLVTKVSHENLRAADFARSVDESLKALAVDYVDLLMVHWPNPEIALAETMLALSRPSARASPATSASPTSTLRCSIRRSGSVPSRWWRCRRSTIPISIRRNC